MRLHHPTGIPVLSKVPSDTDTRAWASRTVLENTARIPSLGSTALNSPRAEDHSGVASNARVNMPVPDPILEEEFSDRGEKQTQNTLHYVDISFNGDSIEQTQKDLSLV